MLVPLAKVNGAPSVDPRFLIASYREGFSAGERPGLAEYTEAVRLLILALQDRGWSLCRVVAIIDQHAIDQQ
jgi:hypothetical protein